MSFIKRVAIITGFLALFLGFFVGTLCPAQYLPWKERETAMTPSVVNSIIVSAGSSSASGSRFRPPGGGRYLYALFHC